MTPAPGADLFGRLQLSLPVVRSLAAGLVLLLVPALLSLGALGQAGTFEVGEAAPRTVLADDSITIVDEEATQQARDEAFEAVDARLRQDPEARGAVVDTVSNVFTTTAAARTAVRPTEDPEGTADAVVPTDQEQVDEIQEAFPDMSPQLVEALVAVPDEQFPELRAAMLDLARTYTRLDVVAEELDAEVESFLAEELPILGVSDDLKDEVVAPLMSYVALPTVTIDVEATTTARQAAADAVEDVATSWEPGDEIATAGEIVEQPAYEALQQSGLQASNGLLRLLRAFGAMAVVVAVLGMYLWRMQPRVWRSPRKLVLLAAVVVGYAGLVSGVSLFTDTGQVAWWYLVPVGAFAMLVALLVHPVVAIASMLPAVVMVTLAAPLSNGVAVFTASAVLVSVPLTIGLGSRGDLRSATLRAGLAMPVIAALAIAVFGPQAEFWPAVGAAALNGVLVALLVQGLLPFLETTFRLPTVTALLDLADRNHPLLRELETKAIGSYNHSVMVANLTERACREIGADPLLGSVAALYHDIGKVRRPHFFIENQYGISNPHDDLEPQVSALIIQEHVVDGVRMATEYRLPPEVVAAIASHHGTMVVGYFYNKAVEQAGDPSLVDEAAFRYKGNKPRGKEAAALLIADCSEAATRAMAMNRGTLPRGLIEQTVDSLLQTRIEDGQFDECDLTFDELRRVRDSVVSALEGIYHPRIAYPGGRSGGGGDESAPTPAAGRAADAEATGDGDDRAAARPDRVPADDPTSPDDATSAGDNTGDSAGDAPGTEAPAHVAAGPADDPPRPTPDDEAVREADADSAPDAGHDHDVHDEIHAAHDRVAVDGVQHLDDLVVPEITAQRP